jgi:hypothetical protein
MAWLSSPFDSRRFLSAPTRRPRPLPARKAQALLAYLALGAGRAQAREER